MTTNSIKSDIIRDFRDRECTGPVVLEFDSDIAPLLECDTLRYERAQGSRMMTLVDELKTRLTQSGDLKKVSKVVLELLLHPETNNVKMFDVNNASSELLSELPQQPEVVFGIIVDATLPTPIELRVITV